MQSSTQLADQQKAEERRAKVFKKNYTKVKPTVVKHVLPNQVMSLYEPTVSTPLPQCLMILCHQVHQNQYFLTTAEAMARP